MVATREEALHEVVSTAAAASTVAVVSTAEEASTAEDTGRLHP